MTRLPKQDDDRLKMDLGINNKLIKGLIQQVSLADARQVRAHRLPLQLAATA